MSQIWDKIEDPTMEFLMKLIMYETEYMLTYVITYNVIKEIIPRIRNNSENKLLFCRLVSSSTFLVKIWQRKYLRVSVPLTKSFTV